MQKIKFISTNGQGYSHSVRTILFVQVYRGDDSDESEESVDDDEEESEPELVNQNAMQVNFHQQYIF